MKHSTQQFHKIFFHISKCLACNAKISIFDPVSQVATIYLAISTKNNIFEYENPQITRRDIEHCDHWEKIGTII